MQSSQYLILAREIKKNEVGIFSFLDVCLHLAVNELPAKGKFDLAIICGPGWETGMHRIHIAVKVGDKPAQKIGFADVEIVDQTHIYTAVVHQMGLIIDNSDGFTIQVYKESGELQDVESTKTQIVGDLILERPFNVTVIKNQQVANTSV